MTPRVPKPNEPSTLALPKPRHRRDRGSGRVYYHTGKKRWVAAVTYEGKVTKRLFKTEPEAQAEVKKLVARSEKKQLAKSRQTFDEYVADWLVDHVLVHRSKRTFETYKSKLAKHVNPRIGAMRLAAIEPRHIRDPYHQLRDQGTWSRHTVPQRRPLSPN